MLVIKRVKCKNESKGVTLRQLKQADSQISELRSSPWALSFGVSRRTFRGLMSEMKNILSGIQITVQNGLALKAGPLPISESQSIVDPPALETSLTRREESIKLIEQGLLLLFRWIESKTERLVEFHSYYYSRCFIKVKGGNVKCQMYLLHVVN